MTKSSPALSTKKARNILSKNHVDTQFIKVVANDRNVMLYGLLVRQDGCDFPVAAIEKILSELSAIGRVQSNLENWDLNSGIRKIFSLEEDE